MLENEKLRGIYKEIACISDVDTAKKIHEMFGRQQISFPKKLYDSEFVYSYIKNNYNGKNVHELAKKFGLTDRRVRQILHK